MLSFERSGLSRKLTLISAWSTGSALLLAFAVFAATHVTSQLELERRQLYTLAGSLAASSSIALLYVDPAQASQVLALATFDGRDDIRQVVLFDRDGKLLARTTTQDDNRAPPPPPDLELRRLQDIGKAGEQEAGPWWSLRIYRGVHFQQDQVGAVMIEAGLPHMWLGVLQSLMGAALAAVVAFVCALVLARRFRDGIAEPIAALIAAARQAADGQPGARLQHSRSDELGALLDSFNDMLVQIASRDARLAQYRDQLERQVGVRTEQLEKAKNAAESASLAKSAFLATMSHEIRTPMNGVLGMTELLLSTPLTDVQRHYTDMVKRSGEHLLVIINDILDFSKIEAGMLTVEYIHFNFRELLDDIDQVFSPQAHAKGIALELAIANDIPVGICGDPNRLRQVLFNLLGNAIKFTETGKITVKVLVTGEDTQAVALRFEVHDTGIGVSREARGRIFTSFSQADGSTTRKHGGTGLGLAISKQLVELMGGSIGVDHALTQGSIFWFALQFDKRRVDEGDSAVVDPALAAGAGDKRALIADPLPESRLLLERQLVRWHMQCGTADASDSAIGMLRDAATNGHPYDVALVDMDIKMGSGLLLAAEIKADPHLAGLRVILLSNERNAADSVQRREAGVAFQLIKPPRACDLFDCMVTPPRHGEGARAAGSAAAAAAAGAAGATSAANSPATSSAISSALSPAISPAGSPASSLISSPATPPALAPATLPAAPRSGQQRQRKVLLAEDNPVNVEVASAMLEGLGLEVRRAANGAEALDAVRGGGFDAVLMDCHMPVMDGMAATAEIRRHEQQRGRRRLPVVAITANALPGDRETCLAAGMDDYLSKPFTQQGLGETLARWIRMPPPAQAPPAQPSAAPARSATPASRQAPVLASLNSQTFDRAPAHAAAPAPAGVANLNPLALDRIRALSPGKASSLVQRVVEAFLLDTPVQLAAMRSALAAAQPEPLRRAAHSLKSASANVGADTMAHACKDLEHLAQAGSLDGTATLLDTLEREFEAVRRALCAILEKEPHHGSAT